MRRAKTSDAKDTAPAASSSSHDAVAHDATAHDKKAEAIVAQARTPAAARFAPGLRTARVLDRPSGRSALVQLRAGAPAEATIAAEVDRAIVERALEQGQSVLVEIDDDGAIWIVGVIETRIPERLVIKADAVVIEGETELTLKSGASGMRLREDGDVELVGSRIMHMSRGLFRIVGRMLRLN
jgi:hypothetical protein